MLAVVGVAGLVGLGPHGHAAVGTAQQALEEVLAGRPGRERHGPSRVALEAHLHLFEQFLGDQRLVRAVEELTAAAVSKGEHGNH